MNYYSKMSMHIFFKFKWIKIETKNLKTNYMQVLHVKRNNKTNTAMNVFILWNMASVTAQARRKFKTTESTDYLGRYITTAFPRLRFYVYL